MTLSDTDILARRARKAHAGFVVDVLVDEVRKVLLGANGYASVSGLVRVIVPVSETRILAWLGAQVPGNRFYWRGREENAPQSAALGAAHVVRASDPVELDRLLRESGELLGAGASDARYFGGCAFDFASERSSEWAAFAPVWFVLPRFELRETESGPRLICNLILPRDRDRLPQILDQIERLVPAPAERTDSLPLPISRQNTPDEAAWKRAVEESLALFEKGEVGKVVLARRATFEFGDRLNAFDLLERLSAETPACFHFLTEIEPGVVFMGAPPERLFRRTNAMLESEAVAGTRPRGASAQDDERLYEELLLSKKDRLEHSFVEDSIRAVFDQVCTNVEMDARPSTMTLARGRHLYSRIRGTLTAAVSDADLIRMLHPTPAVGGHPTAEALELIRRLEAFDRGWYAGPIGWMSGNASEFAVAIRTGLVRSDSLTLYSGAGVVSGSEPRGEWNEIEHKIGDFTNVLGLDLERPKY